MELKGIEHECEVPLPISYKGVLLDCSYRLDILVEGALIVELKSIHKIDPVHEAQLLTYLKLASIKTGLLINFNTPLLINGLKRFVN